MGGKPRAPGTKSRSQITRRPTVAAKRLVSPYKFAGDEPGAPTVSIHDEVTRDYAINPPSE